MLNIQLTMQQSLHIVRQDVVCWRTQVPVVELRQGGGQAIGGGGVHHAANAVHVKQVRQVPPLLVGHLRVML